MPRILIVSTENVCRSPHAAILLAQRLRSRGDTSWSVGSAGTEAIPGQQLCQVVGQRLTDEGLADEAMAHQSRQVSVAEIRSADLILTASAGQRGEVALLDPRASMRTFTLLEAVRLGELVPARVGAPGARIPLSDLVEDLHAARPRLGAAALQRHSHGQKFSTAAIDIVDGHTRSSGDHRTSIRRAHEAAERLTDLLLTSE